MSKFIIGECQQCGQIIAAAVYNKKCCNKDAASFLDSGLRVSIREESTVMLRRCEHYANQPKQEAEGGGR